MQAPDKLHNLAVDLGEQLVRTDQRIATVESCTGGGIAHLVTSVAGSSGWFERGFITYSNDAKAEMVGVDRELIENHGAVSTEVAVAMAEGGIRFSAADYCIAVTGLAGPDGGSTDKPVGTVCFAWAERKHDTIATREHFSGDRTVIRRLSVAHALQGLLDLIRRRV